MTGAISVGSGLVHSDTEVIEMWRAEYLATLTEMISDLTALRERESRDLEEGVLIDARTLSILEQLIRKGLPQEEMTKEALAEKNIDAVTLVKNELMNIIREAVATRCNGVTVWLEHFEYRSGRPRKHTAPYIAFTRVTS